MKNIKVKEIILTVTLMMTAFFGADAQDKKETGGESVVSERRKLFNGYGGGMLLHTGYLEGVISEAGFDAKGPTFGIGGVLRVGIGKHLRVGTEGYMSTAGRLGNGSYIKYGWGGLLMDCNWECGRFYPYAGVTVGGGGRTVFLMRDGNGHDWQKEPDAVLNKCTFLAVSPFIGCEYSFGKAFRLNLKMDWLNAISGGNLLSPSGPRLYFGFVFCH